MIFYNDQVFSFLNFDKPKIKEMKPMINAATLFLGALLLSTFSFSQEKNNHSLTKSKKVENMEDQMERNKATVRKLYEEILNTGKLDGLNGIISEGYSGVRGEKGAAGFAETVNSIRLGFPDIKWTVEDLIADGSKVVVRWTWKGTNTGSFRGFPPSNKQVTDNAIAIYQFQDDKIIKAWIQSDRLGFLQQVGVIAADVTNPPRKN
jgi:steroid delta-isomerase-like uncharacterized protein